MKKMWIVMSCCWLCFLQAANLTLYNFTSAPIQAIVGFASAKVDAPAMKTGNPGLGFVEFGLYGINSIAVGNTRLELNGSIFARHIVSYDIDNWGNPCLALGKCGARKDFSFMALSDTHIFMDGYPTPEEITANPGLEHYDYMQKPKLACQPKMFEYMADPKMRALIMPGDLAEGGSTGPALNFINRWVTPFETSFEQNGSNGGVFLCMGNHDTYSAHWYDPYSSIAKYIAAKHGNLFYSFDIGNVHFVCCGLAPAGGMQTVFTQHLGVFSWLAGDLVEATRYDPNRPIVFFFHYNLIGGTSGWWPKTDKDIFFNMIKDLNVACIFEGHTHYTYTFLWRGRIPVANVSGDRFAHCTYYPNTNKLFVFFDGPQGRVEWSDVLVDYNDPTWAEL